MHASVRLARLLGRAAASTGLPAICLEVCGMGVEAAEKLRERFDDQELALADVRRNYATLAAVNKEDKAQLKLLNERHLRDVAQVGESRLQLEKIELRAAALEVAAQDCERLTEEKAVLEAALARAQNDVVRSKNTERDLYSKVAGLRERADTLEAYKQSASVEVAEMRKELRDARKELAAERERADTAEARNAAAEKELGNLRTHSEKQMQELEAIRANVPELEHKVKASRDEVVVVEKQRRNAEVALAAAIAARTKAEEDKDAAEKRVATSMFEIQALAGQLVEEQSAKTGLSAQLSSASETMAALSFSEDKLEKAEKQLRAEVNKAKAAEEKAARKEACVSAACRAWLPPCTLNLCCQPLECHASATCPWAHFHRLLSFFLSCSVCSEAEAAADRIAELEKESAARKLGWDTDTEAWTSEKASLLANWEGKLEAEVRDGAQRMRAVTGELTAEYERLSEEHAALEQEAKELRAVSAFISTSRALFLLPGFRSCARLCDVGKLVQKKEKKNERQPLFAWFASSDTCVCVCSYIHIYVRACVPVSFRPRTRLILTSCARRQCSRRCRAT